MTRRTRTNRNMVPARNPTTAQLLTKVNNLERRMRGFRSVPQDNPPAFVALPWNSFTFERTDTSTDQSLLSVVTVGNILTQVAAKCALQVESGLTRDANVRIKVISAQVWGTVGSNLTVPDMIVRFYEFNGGASLPNITRQQVRDQQRDLGTLNKPAKCGYHFPSSDRQEILSEDSAGDNDLKILDVQSAEAGLNLTMRVQILWQSSFPDS